MIVNEKDKFVMDYFPTKESIIDKMQTPDQICENILNNFKDHPKELNNLYDLNKWDEYKDNILKQLVLFYNFDFKKISDVFDKICKIKRELNIDGEEIPVYTEKILRYHWSFIHSRRFFGKPTGEEFYILNKDDKNNNKLNEDNNKRKTEDISTDKSLLNTVNITNLNKEKDLNAYFDKLLNQEIDKERTKIFEMELKEMEKNNNSFPINVAKNNEEKKVSEIIEDIKQKEIEKEEKRKKLLKQREEEEKMEE
jgi:hypothetical protein